MTEEMIRYQIRRTTWALGADGQTGATLLEVYETFDNWASLVPDLGELRPMGALCYQSSADYAVFGTWGTAVVDGTEVKTVTHHAIMRQGGLCPFCAGTKHLNLLDAYHDCLFCSKTGLARDVPEGALSEHGRVLAHLEGRAWLDAMVPLIRFLEKGGQYSS